MPALTLCKLLRHRTEYSAWDVSRSLRCLECADSCVLARQELQGALEREDYAGAAALRDGGCAGLVGWWHSRAEDDPVGHILRITPDFGRYTAVKYSAQDLAEMKVLRDCCPPDLLLDWKTTSLSAVPPGVIWSTRMTLCNLSNAIYSRVARSAI